VGGARDIVDDAVCGCSGAGNLNSLVRRVSRDLCTQLSMTSTDGWPYSDCWSVSCRQPTATRCGRCWVSSVSWRSIRTTRSMRKVNRWTTVTSLFVDLLVHVSAVFGASFLKVNFRSWIIVVVLKHNYVSACMYVYIYIYIYILYVYIYAITCDCRLPLYIYRARSCSG